MRFTPKTEAELNPVLPAGTYQAEIVSAEETVSKSGNEMLKLQVRVFHDEGSVLVTDYLMESIAYKLRHFCEAAGILDIYERGELTDNDCVGHSVQVKLRIEKDKNGQYPDKNAISDYVVKRPKEESVTAGDPTPGQRKAAKEAMADPDELPF